MFATKTKGIDRNFSAMNSLRRSSGGEFLWMECSDFDVKKHTCQATTHLFIYEKEITSIEHRFDTLHSLTELRCSVMAVRFPQETCPTSITSDNSEPTSLSAELSEI